MTSPIANRLIDLITGEGLTTTANWRTVGEMAFTDTVAVLLAGVNDPAVTIARAALGEDDGPVTSLATGRRMSARTAALIDGISAHALDYDDVDDALVAHPSAVLVPSLMAVGQQEDATGERLLASFQVGLLASRMLGEALGVQTHYESGWHSSSTIGTVGVAAAVGHLLRLGSDQARNAIGLASSMAAGSRQNFGSMAKTLHIGGAASNGLLAAQLASLGFTADAREIDGPLGFLARFGDRGVDPRGTDQTSLNTDAVGLNVKLYPCCYATHSALEATLEVAEQLPADTIIDAVEVTCRPRGLAPLIHHHPSDGTQAKFCLEYVVAAALVDGCVDLTTFEQDRVLRPNVQELLRRVTVTTFDEASDRGLIALSAATVRVQTDLGQSYTHHVDQPAGHESRPLREDQLRAKFDACVRSANPAAADLAYRALRQLREQTSTRAVVRAITSLHDETKPVDR